MNWKRVLFVTLGIGATIGIIAYLKREFTRLENACYTISGGIIHNLGLSNVRLTLFFKIVNKSDITVDISNVVSNIYVNGMFVTKITNNENQKLYSKGSTIIRLDFEFNPQDLLKAGMTNIDAILGDKEKLIINIKGHFDANAGILKLNEFPFDEKISLKELLTPSDKSKC